MNRQADAPSVDPERSTWRLLRGEDPIADLVVYEHDFPWLYAHVLPRDDIDDIRPLFDEEPLRSRAIAVEAGDDERGAWEEAYARVRAEVALAAPDGHLVANFVLHVEADEAWWTWSDEPWD